jgi:hypothetical protein
MASLWADFCIESTAFAAASLPLGSMSGQLRFHGLCHLATLVRTESSSKIVRQSCFFSFTVPLLEASSSDFEGGVSADASVPCRPIHNAVVATKDLKDPYTNAGPQVTPETNCNPKVRVLRRR